LSAESALAREIRSRIELVVRLGRTPQIILDLDGTLFDNVPRTQSILADRARDLFGDASDTARTIHGMSREAHEYNPVDTLRKHGIQDEETLKRMREAWGGSFFGSDYLHCDEPLAGAVRAAREWWSQGAELNYLTGRHVPEMYPGTSASLSGAGFPVGTHRTHLLMKPAFDLNDVDFKMEALSAILRKGPVVLIVDNDPRVINSLARAVPEAIAVMVQTLYPSDAPEPARTVRLVPDFRELGGE
jgi:hypothetical protein